MNESRKIVELNLDSSKSPIQIDKLIADYEQRGQKFTDTEFPPQLDSLIKRPNEPHPKWKTYTWRRATDFLALDQIKVFDGIDPTDILQGSLGDCYFLCCLSAIAENQDMIKRLFLTDKSNKAGCYAVWLNDNGNWREIIVDDFFPCFPNGQPAFSKSNGNELWVLILEKAYAKMYGSYDIIEGGHPSVALRDLTGAPYDYIESTDADAVWDFAKGAWDKEYILTCYTKSTDQREEQNPLGIVMGHAYSILDVRIVKTAYGQERLLQIRNPWGKFEWQGDWGDDSKLWTEDLKKQVNFVAGDDGEFWMSITDFVKYYEGLGICKFHSDYLSKSISFDHLKTGINHSVIRLIVPEPTHIFLSLNQRDTRCFEEGQNYDYSLVRLMIGQVTTEGLSYVAGEYDRDRNVVLECNLEKGSYVLTVDFKWNQNFWQHFNLSSYSKKEIHFEEIAHSDLLLLQRNLIKTYILGNKKDESEVKVKNYAKEGDERIFKYWGLVHGMAFFYYRNQSLNKKKLREKVQMTQLENLKICLPHKTDHEFDVSILPGDDYIVLYKCVKGGAAYTFATSTTCSIDTSTTHEIENNAQKSYATTTYIDDVADKLLQENDFFDKYVVKRVLPSGNDRTTFGEQDSATNPFGNISGQGGYVTSYQKKDIYPINIDGNPTGTGATPLIQREVSLLSFEAWANLPRNVKDEGGIGWPISDLEARFYNAIDSTMQSPGSNMIMSICFALFLILPIFTTFLREDFYNLFLGWFLVVLLITKTNKIKIFSNTNIVVRSYPYVLLASLILDIYYLFYFLELWNEASDFLIIISLIEFIAKFIYSGMFTYKCIDVYQDFQTELLK